MQPAAENSAESSIQLHVYIMLGKILAAGSQDQEIELLGPNGERSGFEEIELLIDRSVDFLNLPGALASRQWPRHG
jgi:hypothetical protein